MRTLILGLSVVACMNISIAQAFSPTCPETIERCLDQVIQSEGAHCENGPITTLSGGTVTLMLNHKEGMLNFDAVGSECQPLNSGTVLSRTNNEMQFAQCNASFMQHCAAVRK